MKVGIDNVDIGRMEKILGTDTLLSHIYTTAEIDYINLINKKLERMAGIYACKEAFIKATDIGIGTGSHLKDIEVSHTSTGRPYIVMNDYVRSVLKKNECKGVDVSITHDCKIATAICIIY